MRAATSPPASQIYHIELGYVVSGAQGRVEREETVSARKRALSEYPLWDLPGLPIKTKFTFSDLKGIPTATRDVSNYGRYLTALLRAEFLALAPKVANRVLASTPAQEQTRVTLRAMLTSNADGDRCPSLWAIAFGVWANRMTPTNLLWLIDNRGLVALPVPRLTLEQLLPVDFGDLPAELRRAYLDEILDLFEAAHHFAPRPPR